MADYAGAVAAIKAKFVTDWHSSMLAQSTLARFIDNGGFARHIRKVSRLYRDRRSLLIGILQRDFLDQLEMVPSVAGLHIAAVSRSASVKTIRAIARHVGERGVRLQELSYFCVDVPPRAGLLFGYGAIPINGIEEGLRRLGQCFV